MKILKIKTEKRKLGDMGERAAARYLFLHGYRILKRNYIADGHEIDIVSSKGNTLAFIEVKTRRLDSMSPMEERPASAVTAEKQQKILRAASYYKAYHPTDKRMRFDIIEVLVKEAPRGLKVDRINHLIGAFDKDSAYSPKWRK